MVLEFLKGMLEFYQEQLTKELLSDSPNKEQIAWYKKQIRNYKRRIKDEQGTC